MKRFAALTVLVLLVAVTGLATAQNLQKATDYVATQRVRDDIELNWGTDDDVKSLWDSGASLWKLTDSGDVQRFSFDPTNGDIVTTGDLSLVDLTLSGDLATGGTITSPADLTITPGGNDVFIIGDLVITDGAAFNSPSTLAIHQTGSTNVRFRATNDTTGTGAGDGTIFGIGNAERGIFWNYENTQSLIATNNTIAITIENDQDVVLAADLAINGGGVTSTGDLEFTPAGEDFLVDSERVGFRAPVGPIFDLRAEDTSIVDGQVLAQFRFTGDDAAAVNQPGARITGEADGDWASGDNPGRIRFATVPDGSDTLTLAGAFRENQDFVIERPIFIAEVTTPTARPNYAALYSKNNNGLYFQDGAGNEHLIHQEGFSSMWYNGKVVTQALTNEDEFTKFANFQNIGLEDDSSAAVASTGTDDITLSATIGAGRWNVVYHMSVTISGGVGDDLLNTIGIELATPLVITGVTNATPAVVTIVGHGLVNGDMIRIDGVVGSTGVNIDALVSGRTADTFEVEDLDGLDVAAGGAYVSDGTVTHCFEGEAATYRNVSNATLGVIAGAAKLDLANSDKIAFYTANLDNAAKTLQARSLRMGVERLGD